LAFDLPGFGASPCFADNEDSRYFDWVADAVLERCHGPVRLVGFSFGGTVAAGVAPLLGAGLAALSLAAPGSFGKPVRRNIDVRPMRPREGVEVDQRTSGRHNLQELMFANAVSADEATLDLHLDNIAHARFNSRRLSWQDRIEDDLRGVAAPIQMIWGLGDRMATPSVEARIERCRRINRAIRFDLIPGAGHWVQHERPEAYNTALLSFLTACGARSARP
jgi:pimeloyl-ACP methyl ester carboxylesterase